MKNKLFAAAVLNRMARRPIRGLRNCLLAAGALLVAQVPSQVQAQTYDFYYLGSMGSNRPFIYNTPTLNNMGQAAGTSSVSGVLRATVWSGAVPSYPTVPAGSLSGAVGINDSGVVAGAIGSQAAQWSGGAYTLLSGLGGVAAWSSAINNAGQIAGDAYLPSGVMHATLWTAGVPTDLGALPGTNNSFANAINNSGVVAGVSDGSALGGPTTAVTWTGGAGPVILPRPGYNVTQAFAINDSGVVGGSGMVSPTGGFRALLWNGGSAPVALPGLGATWSDNVYGLNNAGDAVGLSAAVSGYSSAVLWPAGTGTLVDLNNAVVNVSLSSLGYVLTEADDINDLGWITGRLRNLNTGLVDLFLLIPAPAGRP